MARPAAHKGKKAPAKKATKKVAAKPAKQAQKAPAVAPDSTPAQGVMLSINQAADEFGHDRRTITKRIAELGLRAAGDRGGYPVYRLKDLLELERKAPDGQRDPDKMSPFEQQAYYKAQSEKMKVDVARGSLLRREEVEVEWARVMKAIAQELDTFVDEVERDVGAPPLVLEKLDAKIDTIRQRMYERIVTIPDEEPAGDQLELEDVG